MMELSTVWWVLTVQRRHPSATQIMLQGHKKHQILSLLLSGTLI